MYPIDHMSHFVVYFDFFNICGAIYKGVPTIECKSLLSKWSTYLANPKSANLNYPLLFTKILAGFKSRWIIPLSTSWLKPKLMFFYLR
jgi:hypothetical protein